jgi:hypothetical protein
MNNCTLNYFDHLYAISLVGRFNILFKSIDSFPLEVFGNNLTLCLFFKFIVYGCILRISIAVSYFAYHSKDSLKGCAHFIEELLCVGLRNWCFTTI